MCLREKGVVPEPLFGKAGRVVEDSGSGQSAFRLVVVGAQVSAAFIGKVGEQGTLQPEVLHIGIFAFLYR
ncbi:hypothetical protein SDC9_171070 [bioreactor metagenome]|uniref:Uncharacterized protein n=1 Tax=bioreactor metagenome TaxID=1076179 RepID=A0A645G9U2_9ZZZZ